MTDRIRSSLKFSISIALLAATFTVIAASANAADPPAPITHEKVNGDYFTLRSGLNNCRIRFERDHVGRVVFLGGSITHMNGWRQLVAADLQKRFPHTKFEFYNEGIPSTGSVPGAFRFERDVLSHGRVDLLFEEASVNDEVNFRKPIEMTRGMEGIVRHARLAQPDMDVVEMYFVDPHKMQTYNEGKTPVVIQRHDEVAERYDVPAINLALEVTQRINKGEFTWAKDFRSLHPAPFGQKLYAATIGRMFDAAWSKPLAADAKITPHVTPSAIDAFSYWRGKLVDLKQAKLGDGWELVHNWHPKLHVGTRPGFVDVPTLVASKPGATLTFTFTGTAIGIFVAAGPDAGAVDYRIDDGDWKTENLYTPWSSQLYIPWAHVLEPALSPTQHTLELRVSKTKDDSSKGHTVDIIHLLVNGPAE